MEITEAQVFEAFGLGEQAQEPAAPATENREEKGAQGQEVAEPAQETETGEEEKREEENLENQGEPDQADVNPEDGEEDPEKKPLTVEQRRENAERRRQQQEQQRKAEIDRAVSEAREQERKAAGEALADFFRNAGLKNTITGEPITTMEEFQQWNTAFKAARIERDLKAGKLTPEDLNDAIGSHPAVQAARKAADTVSAEEQARKAAAEKAKIDAEIAEIGKVDPSIKSVGDLLKMPNAKEFYDMVRRGYSFKDAHYLLNREKIEKQKIEAAQQAARQAAMNSQRSKEHMQPAGKGQGTGAKTVPKAEMEVFRAMMPKASDAEIIAYYNRYTGK